jgi:transcriptional regulator with XRE-family HTH domain
MARKTPPYAEFARRLFIAQRRWELKTKKEFSREDLAAAVELSDSTVSNWYTGKAMPSVDQLEIIGKVLRANPGWLAFGDQAVITNPEGEPIGFPSQNGSDHRQQGKRGEK